MFYCNDCGKKRGWPCAKPGGGLTIPPSAWGTCELCHKLGHTNDVPSSHLDNPDPKADKARAEALETFKREAKKRGKSLQEFLDTDIKNILEKSWEIQQRTGKPVSLDDLVKELNDEYIECPMSPDGKHECRTPENELCFYCGKKL